MRFNFKRLCALFFIFTIFYSSINFNFISGESIIQTEIDSLPFRQEIIIPIDTSLIEAKYQPIDIRIEFDNPCWGLNETKNSIRIAYDDGIDLIEIESQIYDLNIINNEYISSCSVVFLIPFESDGNEKYYVLYSDVETSSANYKKHLSVIDTHYFYEPISGQIIDFDYYQIIEDGYIIYGICQEGELLENGMSNSVVKLKPNSTVFETVYAEQIASFSMTYSINPSGETTGTEWASNVKKSVLVDGNIMIRLRIEGISINNEIKTDNIYTYYYKPLSTKSLSVNVNHEILKTINVEGDKEREGTYASLSTIKARSATIDKMNIGEILPYIHFFSEDEKIKEYSIPIDPDSDPAEWILSSRDDDDLGSKSWMCMDDINTGLAHGLIFESNTGFIEGVNDGIQVKSSVHQHVKLPGLEADSGDLFAVRNAYEDGQQNLILSEGTNVFFNVNFITFQKGGYESIDKESNLFKILIKNIPISRGNETKDEEQVVERYSLDAYLHKANSFPMGSLLSAALGRNFSYITIEIYKENKLSSSGSAAKLPIGSIDLNFDNTTLLDKIRIIFNIFDWRNISFYKKVRFSDLDKGLYLIKVFRENPFRAKDRQFIGFLSVDLNEDKSVHIYCKPQAIAEFSIIDSNNEGIENVKFLLLSDDNIISSEKSDNNGYVNIKAPLYRDKTYVLKVMYDGFLVFNEELIFGFKNRYVSYKDSFSLSLYQLKVKVKDLLGLTPSVNLNPILSSNNMVEKNSINLIEENSGEYFFNNLLPEEYIIKLSYKSFEIEEKIIIEEDKSIEIIFPAEYKLYLICMDSIGGIIKDGRVKLERSGKIIDDLIDTEGISEINVPPGSYALTIIKNDEEIAKQNIDIKGDKKSNIISLEKSQFHINMYYIGIIIILLSIVYILWKRNYNLGIKTISIGLIIIALISPFWTLTGDNGSITTSTNTYIIPSKIITITNYQSAFGGEISLVPKEFTMILDLLSIFLLISIILLTIDVFIKNKFVNKFKKVSIIISFIIILFLLISTVLFIFAMSEVTKVGVGTFSGGGELSVTIPGSNEIKMINCTWGFGLGLYLLILSIILNLIIYLPKLKSFVIKIKNKI